MRIILLLILLTSFPLVAEINSSCASSSVQSVTSSVQYSSSADKVMADGLSEFEIILDGTYEFRTDPESIDVRGKQICFFPNKLSSQYIPRPVGDVRVPWFCFSNFDLSASALDVTFVSGDESSNNCGVKGVAKIIITDYHRYEGDGDENDFATLIKVLDKSNAEILTCSN